MLTLVLALTYSLFRASSSAPVFEEGDRLSTPNLDLRPIFANLRPPSTDPLVRFRPKLYQEGESCVPHVWVNAAGDFSSTTAALQTCKKARYGGQLVGRKIQYEDKYALVYTTWMPFNYGLNENGLSGSSMSTEFYDTNS